MRVVIAPDSFGGTLDPWQAAQALADGWRRARPDDELVLRPMADGGEGLLVAVEHALRGAGRAVERRTTEVADARGLAVDADWLLVDDGAWAVVESALACGLALVPEDRRDPRMTTTWGVGQLVAAAAAAGARRVGIGLGGSATVDGGAGALSGLGFRVTVADGSGLKVGGEDLPRVAGIGPGWVDEAVRDLEEVVLLADVDAVLADAAPTYGPQKGADEATVAHLAEGLATWADVVEGAFDRPGLRDVPGTGAAGGLGFALAGALGARFERGAAHVADLVGLDAAFEGADLVVTGEGRLDRTSSEGKVVGEVLARAARAGVPVLAVSGAAPRDGSPSGLQGLEVAAADGPGPEPAADVAAAAQRLAAARCRGPAQPSGTGWARTTVRARHVVVARPPATSGTTEPAPRRPSRCTPMDSSTTPATTSKRHPLRSPSATRIAPGRKVSSLRSSACVVASSSPVHPVAAGCPICAPKPSAVMWVTGSSASSVPTVMQVTFR